MAADTKEKNAEKIAALLKRRAQINAQVQTLKARDSEAERKARMKRLIELGALFDLAGLADKDRGALLGALLGMAKVDDAERWRQWKNAGDALLTEREETRKSAKQPPVPTASSAEPETRPSMTDLLGLPSPESVI